MHVEFTSRPPKVAPGKTQEGDRHEPAPPLTPIGPERSLPQRPVAVAPRSLGSPRAPDDFTEFRVTTPKVAVASLIAEPSVAAHGPTVFMTWNWGAALSTDGGGTWNFINPFTQFPLGNGALFCCDQVVQYDPGHDLWIWVLQYDTGQLGNNVIRLAVAQGTNNLLAGKFSYWDLTPQQVGAGNGTIYDQPKIALTNEHLFFEATQYTSTTSASWVLRFSLAQLATGVSGSSLAYDQLNASPFFSPGFTQGATTQMYFASHDTTTRLRIWEWKDSSATPTYFYSLPHASYPRTFPYTCPRLGAANPAKSDWCQRRSFSGGYAHDDRIQTGWVSGGTIGFAWDASQGTVGTDTFNYPHVRIIELTEDTSGTVIAQKTIWSPNLAYSYSAIAPNARGELAGSVVYGGGTGGSTQGPYEDCGILTVDPFTANPTVYAAIGSLKDTSDSLSGDYLAARGNGGNPNTWSSTCYRLSTSDTATDPYYYVFGKEKDSPIKTLTVARAGNGTGSVTSAPAGIDCGATCSSTFWQDMTVTLTAAPSGTDVFAGWSGACTGAGPCTVTMSDSKSVTATFKKTFVLSVANQGTGSGTVTSAPGSISCGATCTGRYVDGTSVVLTATAAKGSVFLGWSGPCSGTGTCTVSVDGAKTVVAQFALKLGGAVARGRISLTKPTPIAGGTYVLVVTDRSKVDNFHLVGPGVNRKTGVRGRGTVIWQVTFASRARYRYGSDRHRRSKKLHKSFRTA